MSAEFIGYYTIFGPQGYVVADDVASAETLVKELTIKWPRLLCGRVRQNWRDKQFRITVWTRNG